MFATPPRVAAAFSDSPLSVIASSGKLRAKTVKGGDEDAAHIIAHDALQLTNAQDPTLSLADEEFEVEAIIGRRGGRNGHPLEYLVRWKDYTSEDDTWVLREDIMADDLVAEYDAKHSLPAQSPRKKRKRFEKDSLRSRSRDRFSTAPTNTSSHSRKRRHANDDRPLFYKTLPDTVCECLIPLSTATCEPIFGKLLRKKLYSSNTYASDKQMIAIHPATFVVLRTSDHASHIRPFVKPALATLVEGIDVGTIALFDRGAFPESSPFAETDARLYIDGGQAFKLAWRRGFHNIDEETYHIIATIAHLQQSQLLPERMKLRMVARKIKPNLKDACRHFGVDVIDLFDLKQMLCD